MKLPRYPFNRDMVRGAPDEPGVFGLFERDDLIYIGKAMGGEDSSLRARLSAHCSGLHGDCTRKATVYTWEISLVPTLREKEALSSFRLARGTEPRCQQKVA